MPIPNTYVKINKIDHNLANNDIALGQATKLRIKYTTLSDYVTIGNIIDRTEYPTYWLYKVQSLGSNTADNYIKDYQVSASKSSITSFIPIEVPINNYTSVIGNSTGYFDLSLGYYTLGNTPNIPLSITASFNVVQFGGGSAGTCSIAIGNYSNLNFIASASFSSGFTGNLTISSSYIFLYGDILVLTTKGGINASLTSNSLLITQSIASSSQEYDSVIIEPYITEPNFYNSDDNALLNSVNDQRESTFALDVDYSDGIIPINFDLLVSGSGTPATVPDSNYTSKKSTILKYEGSKSTSQLLNTWSPPGTIGGGYSDTGTYGKLPTVESLKTYIAYCDWIGGWPPEYENASAMNVIYLIKADGTVVIPNTSKDSLSIMQQTFQTGERVFISTKNSSISTTSPYRTVIRGGSHLEPILYTQYGGLPGVTFNTTMSFEDIVLAPGGNVGNYAASYKNSTVQMFSYNSPQQVNFQTTIQGISVVSNSYPIPTNAITDGVSLTVTINPQVGLSNYGSNPRNWTFVHYFYKNAEIIFTSLEEVVTTPGNSGNYYTLTSPIFTLPAGTFNSGDNISYYIKVVSDGDPYNAAGFNPSRVFFTVSQYPIYTQPVTSSGVNSIWNWGNKTTYPYIITSSQTTLTQLYGNPNVRAKDISGSGFNSIQLPWNINYGDEFKFEGREDFVYMVKNIYAPADSGSGRVFQTGSLEVHFNANLPVSASSSVFNLDHFLIRRYVDDAAQNVITGFKPLGSEGPYLIKPEFVVPELNKNIDEVILDLTQKGLIT
jgi:hypothetical protein